MVAFKPGNVSLRAPGHDMTAADFLSSARAAVPALAAPGAGVGERVLGAIRATRAVVDCNTNLGIVLLLAPLAAAAETAAAGGSLRSALRVVLDGLTIEDARHAFAAIRLAAPGGLGAAAAEDVAGEPSMDLRSIMALAADRDAVAAQYVNGFEQVFATGVPLLRELRARWHSLAWASTACFCELLATTPDSHVRRRHGQTTAEALSRRVLSLATDLKACENPRQFSARLTDLDRELKSGGVNPGTSADLTVASIAALILTERFRFDSE